MGETQEDFDITRNNFDKLEITRAHIFPYSRRKGTVADKMENHLESFGIAHSTLEHIREIFIDGYTAK